MKDNEPIDFEEFSGRTEIRIPKYNNLISYFNVGGMNAWYAEQEFFKRFKRENPKLEEKIRKGVVNSRSVCDSTDFLKSIEPELYEAYKIMREYGASDADLFT